IAFAISSASLEETGRTADDTDWNPECYGSSTCRSTPPFTSNRITGPTFQAHFRLHRRSCSRYSSMR
ncbi:hypothetical protein, partial [Salinibacter ruber]|uniref:hypothetical protein n=1 Tax=Salinibacter ruber TaxID=146919 RepID=UPI001CA53B8B